MSKNDQLLAVLISVLGSEPNVNNSFIAEGGDSFNALIVIERLAEDLDVNIDLDELLSDRSIKSVLGFE